jgi:L-arabinose isomerase
MSKQLRARIGIFGVGLQAYWAQFDGLEARLTSYINELARQLETLDADIVNEGLVDTPEKAFQSGLRFKQADVDLVLLYATTYAVSSTILPVVRKAGVPVVVLNLSSEAAIPYAGFNRMNDRTAMTAEWLAYCSACSVPEISNVLRRSNIPFFQVTGVLKGDAHVSTALEEWVRAASVARTMYYNRLGLMGTYYGGMLDIYTDLTLQCATFGGHIEILEVDELSALRRDVTEAEISQKLGEIGSELDVQDDCPASELQRAAITAVALDKLVANHQLGALAYYHKSTPNTDNETTITSVILGNSLLTGRGIPVAGEYEVKNVQAMKILDSFGAGGSFTEYYAMDYIEDVVLMGHDGPCHPRIAEGRVKVRPLQVYHGKAGSGLSVEMSVAHGPVTLLSVIEGGDGKLKLLLAEAESVAGPILEIGNTNSRYKFAGGGRNFVEAWNAEGPAHHCAVGRGHLSSMIKKLGHILKIDVIEIR